MESWQSKEIGTGISSAAPSNAIQEAFGAAFIAAGQPSGMAVFSRYDIRDDAVTVYFSPAAAILAAGFEASPCSKPEPGNRLALLVGDASSWDIYFPEYSAQRRRGEL
jgi:hypothetical protein